jgi:hypothetical protein
MGDKLKRFLSAGKLYATNYTFSLDRILRELEDERKGER